MIHEAKGNNLTEVELIEGSQTEKECAAYDYLYKD